MVDVPQDFWAFEHGLPWQEIWVSLVCMFLGLLMHWVKKATTKQATWNLFRYCIDYPGYTVSAILAVLGADATFIFTGASAQMTWPNLIYTCFVTGFAADSAFNKSDPPPPKDSQP